MVHGERAQTIPPLQPIRNDHRSYKTATGLVHLCARPKVSITFSFLPKIPIMVYSDGDGHGGSPQSHQSVVVMRHGDRLDNVAPRWAASAARPWDPPLAEDGRVRAFATGEKLRKQLGFPIHRVFVSPFLRCLQTAAEIVAVAKKSDDPNDVTPNGVVLDPSKIKVSIEYGLCEMMNSLAIRDPVAPKDGVFTFSISECESVLPDGTVDNSVEMVYKELPRWKETAEGARARYLEVIKTLADKYHSENLLLVTHGEGVGSAAASGCATDVMVTEVEYCAFSVLRRPIAFGQNHPFTAGDFIGSPKGLFGISLTEE